MKSHIQRHFAGESELTQVIDLLLAARTGKFLYRYPTFWRLELLLTSRVWEPIRDACVWLAEDDTFTGFAYLWRREREAARCSFEMFMRPDVYGAEFYAEMLDWAQGRIREYAGELGKDVALGTRLSKDEVGLVAVLEHNGFALESDCDLLMRAPVPSQVPERVLPSGYTLRPLNGEAEVEAYEALFDFTSVSRVHRLRLLNSPEYCHLVIEAPDGALVAYCEGSIYREEWRRSGLRIGWIDYIGTLPEQQQRGLGLAVLLGMLRQFQRWNVETAMLTTMFENKSAQSVFRKVGFQPYEANICGWRSYSAHR